MSVVCSGRVQAIVTLLLLKADAWRELTPLVSHSKVLDAIRCRRSALHTCLIGGFKWVFLN